MFVLQCVPKEDRCDNERDCKGMHIHTLEFGTIKKNILLKFLSPFRRER